MLCVKQAGADAVRLSDRARLRAAFLISAKGWRGSGTSFGKIASGLQERGHDVLVIAVSDPVTYVFKSLGIPTRQLKLGDTGLREARALRAELRAHRAQVLMADTPRDARLAVLASRGLGCAAVYRFNVVRDALRSDLGNRFLLSGLSLVVYQAEAVRRRAIEGAPWLGRRRSALVPNGFDTERFRPDLEAGNALRQRWGIAPDRPIVMFAGHLSKQKAPEHAIDALAAILPRTPSPVFVVVGRGALENEVRQRTAALGIETIITGTLPPEEMPAAYNAADVVIHPSRWEILPNVVGEAMACGRAIIASDADGTRELTGDNTVLLAAPGDIGAFTAHLENLLKDPTRRARLGAAARNRIVHQFPLRRMVDGYEALFASLARRR